MSMKCESWGLSPCAMIIEPVTIRTIRTAVFAHLSARHTKNKRRIKSSNIIYHHLLYIIIRNINYSNSSSLLAA